MRHNPDTALEVAMEQRQRFEERLADPMKRWKFRRADLETREKGLIRAETAQQAQAQVIDDIKKAGFTVDP